jgi:hypothetical protein
MLKKGKVSMQDAKKYFRNLLSRFTLYAQRYVDLKTGNFEIKIKNIKNLKTLADPFDYLIGNLSHLGASYVIVSMLLQKGGKNIITELYKNFENNVDTIERLFRKIKEYSKEEFLEEVKKLQ